MTWVQVPMDADDVFARTTRNRRAAADLLASLTPDQWQAPTLCEGWTVRHLAAHLVQPMVVGFGRFLLASLRHRGDTAATVDHVTRSLARREPTELVSLLRERAADRVDPPRVGPMGPFADTCIHLRDIARPLGLPADVPREDWLLLLDHLASGTAAPALTRPGWTDGLALRATDADWARGSGAVVEGAVEALAMAVTGRPAALDDLRGPGVGVLRERLAR
ncbi:maleylpyruvate isomerase family mycothiol-dependent enzyme [Nocardioides renjunii]|uniref:maleylpyruvate isomerase family mycothiol-dependent enzyme n=1 Tax=Nocardioides renjunii TaxID=3095075 RepID=UPI002B0022A2|nr:maleylpyruvate isomerase family mycothiol-dependent enzyme [Nocardioides sp. S-34]WQQ23344.1 maleylpyruvate isomerase family mycothiol-dependent enzyme [Nocardioides sp. S-34]